jgi:NAD(P)-dependent dehydrogenase (short-subunit alcohol dehydrogenase family)
VTGRIVLVTGGAGGMGAAIRARFEAADDSVVAADLHGGDVTVDVSSTAGSTSSSPLPACGSRVRSPR